MTLNINIRISHDGQGQPCGIKYKDLIESELRTKQVIMATNQETVDQLQGLVDKATKILAEAQANRAAVDAANVTIEELKAIIQNQGSSVPAEVTAKIAELAVKLEAVDATTPDA